MDASVSIKCTPNPALLDENIEVIVSRLDPHQNVTLMCRVQEQGHRYFSWAYYESDERGCVNVTTMTALPGGSYEGVEPMGFVWSQKQEPGQRPGNRLMKNDVTTPLVTKIYILNRHVSPEEGLSLIDKDRALACASCDRLYMAAGVERIEVREGRLVGTLFIPAGLGPHPGVIDLFGTIGIIVEYRSALLASRGIASFSLSYFTAGKRDGLITEIEYFEEGINYLLRHPKVRKPFVGIIGVSKGAELALLVSSLCHQVRACVEINGADILTSVEVTYKGKVYPSFYGNGNELQSTEEGYVFVNAYDTVSAEDYATCSIPVEQGQCDYLLIHGAEDKSVAITAATRVPERLRRHNKSNYRVLLYPGAGHLIEPPHSPHFFATYFPLFSGLVVWGGTTKAHAVAQEDAWRNVLSFFKNKLQYEMLNLQAKL